MAYHQYKTSISGQEVNVKINLDFEKSDPQKPKVKLSKFSVGDIELSTLNSGNFHILESILSEEQGNSIEKKQEIWLPRGDGEEIYRCFLIKKSASDKHDEQVLGYYNIGTSTININYQGQEFLLNETGCFFNMHDEEIIAKIIYASTIYFDLINREFPELLSKFLIHTSHQDNITKAFLDAGWSKLVEEGYMISDSEYNESGAELFKAIARPPSEGQEQAMPPRFINKYGEFMERSAIEAASGDLPSFSYDNKNLLIYESGSLLGAIDEIPEQAAEA